MKITPQGPFDGPNRKVRRLNAHHALTPDSQQKQDRGRKRKAILAGGVVLGLGAAVTLAAWSDDVFADGIFNTGSFELQGSTNGALFADYDGPAGPPPAKTATLEFQLDAEQMAPSQTVYAPLTIATSAPSTLAGTFTLDSVSVDGSYGTVLTYRIFNEVSHGANCNPTNAQYLAPGALWAGGDTTLASEVVGGAALPVAKTQGMATTSTTPSTGRQHLCLAVTMGDVPEDDTTREDNQIAVAAQTQPAPADNSTTVTWVFNGQSTDA